MESARQEWPCEAKKERLAGKKPLASTNGVRTGG